MFEKVKNALWEVLSPTGALSAKRVGGLELLLNAIVLSYINPGAEAVINAFLLTGATLLGASIASDIVTTVSNKKKDKVDEK